jgi:hypothetical protein
MAAGVVNVIVKAVGTLLVLELAEHAPPPSNTPKKEELLLLHVRASLRALVEGIQCPHARVSLHRTYHKQRRSF